MIQLGIPISIYSNVHSFIFLEHLPYAQHWAMSSQYNSEQNVTVPALKYLAITFKTQT